MEDVLAVYTGHTIPIIRWYGSWKFRSVHLSGQTRVVLRPLPLKWHK
jgi:hypothetical protein